MPRTDLELFLPNFARSSLNELAFSLTSHIAHEDLFPRPLSRPCSPKIESVASSPWSEVSETNRISDGDVHQSDSTCNCFACEPESQRVLQLPDCEEDDGKSALLSYVSSPEDLNDNSNSISPSIESDCDSDEIRSSPNIRSDDLVMQKSFQDPELNGTYDNLPRVRCTKLVSSVVDTDIPGFFEIGTWKDLLPEQPAVINKIKQAILFQSAAHYVNPSRADPKMFTVKAFRRGLYLVDRSAAEKLAVAVTTGCCMESKVVYGRVRMNSDMTSSIYKIVRLLPHTLEFQRFAGFVGDIYDTHICNAPCYCSRVLTFATSAASYDGDCVPDSRLRRYLKEKLIPKQQQSSSSAKVSSSTSNAIVPIRKPETQIPIYDARLSDFTFEHDLNDIARLPLYKRGEHEIPVGSCITVGHTIGMIAETNDREQDFLTLNVQWIILWAIPSAQIF